MANKAVSGKRTLLGAAGLSVAMGGQAFAGNDVKINADGPGTVQNEVRIVRNFALNALIVAYNDSNASVSPYPLGVSFSANNGTTWIDTQLSVPQDPFNPPGSTLPAIFDPFIGTSPINNIYVGYIATQGGLPPPGSGVGGGLYIERSENGGMTWSGPTMIAANPAGSGPTYRLNDRPTMDVSVFGRLVVTWIKDVGVNAPTSDIYYAASNPPPGPGPGPFPPTGLNFGVPVTVNDNPNGTDFANVPDVAIHPNGRTYVAWIDVDVTVCDASSAIIKIDSVQEPGPPIFGMDKSVVTIDPLPKHLSTSAGPGTDDDARAGSYPSIAVDDGDGSGQTIYMTYAAEVPGGGGDEGDIFFTKSIDGGNNWTMPLRVNDDSTITDQMHPAIDAMQSPSGTHVVIAWYDKRHCVNDDRWDVYMARSVNGGTTFATNRLVSDQTFATPTAVPGANTATCPPAAQPERWLGEYMGLDLDQNRTAHIAFTSSRNDTRGDVYYDIVPATAVKPADINNSGQVNIDDLVRVISAWGPCTPCQSCPADVFPIGAGNGQVNIDDLVLVITSWG